MSNSVCIGGVTWKDVTTFSRGETNRTPHVWQADVPMVRLLVLDNHIYCKGMWAVTCHPFSSDPIPLQSKDRDDAMRKATGMLADVIRKLARSLSYELSDPATSILGE